MNIQNTPYLYVDPFYIPEVKSFERNFSFQEVYFELLAAIERRDVDGCYDLLDAKEDTFLKELFLELYDRMVEEIETEGSCEPGSMMLLKRKFCFLLTLIYDYFPNLGRYLVVEEWYSSDGKRDDWLVQHMLTPDGIRFVADYLYKKGSLTLQCDVYDDYQSFEEMLNDMRSGSRDAERKVCIVRTYDSKYPLALSHHVAPIFMKKKPSGGYDFFLSDSTNHAAYIHPLLRRIASIFPESHIYTSTVQRQSDESSCSIFSLRDVVHMARDTAFFPSLVESNPLAFEGAFGIAMVRLIGTLPFEMAKTTQSLTAIEHIRVSSPTPDRIILKKKNDHETLQSNVERHVISDCCGKRYNMLIQQRFYKYVRLMIEESCAVDGAKQCVCS